MQEHNPIGYGQTQTGTAGRARSGFIYTVESIKNTAEFLFCYAVPGITYLDDSMFRCVVYFHRYSPTFGGIFNAIVNDVGYDLLQLESVARYHNFLILKHLQVNSLLVG